MQGMQVRRGAAEGCGVRQAGKVALHPAPQTQPIPTVRYSPRP